MSYFVFVKNTLPKFVVVVEQLYTAANCRDWRRYKTNLMGLSLLSSALTTHFLLKTNC